MNMLSINQKIYIKRSDGRVHLANIVKLDGSATQSVTVEWSEGKMTRGKEVPVEAVINLNGHILNKRGPAQGQSPRRNLPAQQQQQLHLTDKRRLNANCYVMPRVTGGNAANVAQRRQGDTLQDMERMRLRPDRRRQLILQQSRRGNPAFPNLETVRLLREKRLELQNELAGTEPRAATAEQGKRGIGLKNDHQIIVCIRKRPLTPIEVQDRELDVISVPHRELLVVHEPRRQVNLTRFLNNHKFRFDYSFGEHSSNAEVYQQTARPLVDHVFEGGNATCFAYGQTGSGKTHTMGGGFNGSKGQNYRDGIYVMAAKDFFSNLEQPQFAHLNLSIGCSFFELYGTRVYDLLMPGKPELRVLEDGKQQVRVIGLTEEPCMNTENVLELLELGNSVRASGQTSANSMSSRSHAIFQIVLRTSNKSQIYGKFSLIDLAGNERGADNGSTDRRTRLEGSEINKSLLALKECIRAMGLHRPHLPFRGSKLTQVLRDSFLGGRKVKTCMIATISPGLRSVEHTLNTLRYADRVKELTPQKHPTVQKIFAPEPEVAACPRTSSLKELEETPRDPNDTNKVWNTFNSGHALQEDNLSFCRQETVSIASK